VLFLGVPALLLALLAAACGGGSHGASVVYPQTDIMAAVGMSIPRDRPVLQNGAGGPFTITPALPAGIAMDPDTGAISGRPQAESAAQVFTVTATSGSGPLAVPVRITVGPTGSLKSQVLNVPVQIQRHSEWCEIASCASILDCKGVSLTQCQMFNYSWNIGYACWNSDFYWDDPIIIQGCEQVYGARSSETDLLTHYGVPCTGRYSALTFGQIKEEIDADRPFAIHWFHENTDGHSVVGMGWDESGAEPVIVLMDPMRGIRRVTYAWACLGYEPNSYSEGNSWNAWDRTITLDP
jgi:hypothetical protein